MRINAGLVIVMSMCARINAHGSLIRYLIIISSAAAVSIKRKERLMVKNGIYTCEVSG